MIDQLAQQGVRHFCIAPGSRSTALAIAAAEHPKAKIYVHFDERGLGFYALGLAKALESPVALIATSGTAVGNLLPSVMEAHHTGTPLLLLTADRPPELRDAGANQTTDQIKLFTSFVRWQVDLPCHLNEGYFRSIMAQSYFYACQNPSGPVHINCQFREPLYTPTQNPPESSPFPIAFPQFKPRAEDLKPWENCSKGIILIGRLPRKQDLHPILQLAGRLKWPIFADVLSDARCFPTEEQVRHYDWIFKRGSELRPDLVLHFGDRLTSKASLSWLQTIQPGHYVHVSPRPFLIDPARCLTARIQADPAEFCPLFRAKTDPDWLSSWKAIDSEIEETLSSFFAEKPSLTEAHILRALSDILPSHFACFFGSGMPIRDADHFLFPTQCRGFYGNRGLSGIDGNIATLAGLSDGLQGPVLGVIGDQACLHDLNSLPLLKKTRHPVYLIVSNNFGGGIFCHLPVAESPHFEKLFAATHAWNFKEAAQMFQLPYFSTHSAPQDLLAATFASGQSALIEIFTCRTENHRFQKEFADRCSHTFA